MKTQAVLLVLAGLSFALPSFAKYENSFESRDPIHSNIITVNYIKTVRIDTANTWIGTKVFKIDDSCFEVKQDINIEDKDVTFSDVINAAEIPDTYKIGKLNSKTTAVSCDMYEVDRIKVVN